MIALLQWAALLCFRSLIALKVGTIKRAFCLDKSGLFVKFNFGSKKKNTAFALFGARHTGYYELSWYSAEILMPVYTKDKNYKDNVLKKLNVALCRPIFPTFISVY